MKGLLQHQPIIMTLFNHLPVISMMSLKRAYPSCQNKFPNIYQIFEQRFNKLLRRYYNVEGGIKSFIDEPFFVPGDAVSSILFDDEPFVGCVYVVLNSSYNLDKYENFLISKCIGYVNYSQYTDKTISKEFPTADEYRLCCFSDEQYMIVLLGSSTIIPERQWRYTFSSSQLCVFNSYKAFCKRKPILPDLFPPPPPKPSSVVFYTRIGFFLAILFYFIVIVLCKNKILECR